MHELRFRRFVWFLANRTGADLDGLIAEEHRAGTLDRRRDRFIPSPRLLAQVLGTHRGGPPLQGAIRRPAPASTWTERASPSPSPAAVIRPASLRQRSHALTQ